MSVYKRGDVWYADFTVDGRRYRLATGQHSKPAAARKEGRLRAQASDGTLDSELGGVPATRTLKQVASLWFASRIADKKSASTYAIRLDIALRLMGEETPIDAIDTPQIEEAINLRRHEKTRQGKLPAPATVNRDLIDMTMRPILRYAKRTLKIPGLPDIEWKDVRLREPTERTRSYTTTEMDDYAAALPIWYVELRDFYGRYGLRLKEAFFAPSAVDTRDWTVTIMRQHRKNRRAHTFPLIGEDIPRIAARLSRAAAAALEVIWYRETAKGLVALSPRGFQAASRKALDKANIPDARAVHDLRHHAATQLLRGTGNLKLVQHLLGHENIASTGRYAHVYMDDLRTGLGHTYGTDETNEDNSAIDSTGLTGT